MSKQRYPQTTATTTATGTVRKGRDSYSSTKLWAKRDRKREEAEDRQAKYDALSTAEKLAGLPVGACARQRTRLEKQLATEKAAKKPTVTKK